MLAGFRFRAISHGLVLRRVAAVLVCLHLGCAQAGDSLKLLFMASSGAQRTAWTEVVDAFSRANPDVEVQQTVLEQELYKREFEQIIRRDAVDVAFWFAGERLRQMVQSGTVVALDDALGREVGEPAFTRASWDAVRIGQARYAWPFSYYAWGFFYSRSLFERLGLRVPTQWLDLLDLCRQLQEQGVTPFAVGAQAGWPAAAWFDYLNLRINGLDFHRRLLQGQESFRDPRVTRVLQQWQQLLQAGYFLPDTLDTEWDSVLPYLYRQKVGMVLTGGFAAAKIPASSPGRPDLRADIGFFPFPTIDKRVRNFEDAPLDVMVLPASGKNRQAAHRFLRFLVEGGQLQRFNAAMGTLAPLTGFTTDSALSNPAKRQLDRAQGLAFFFDRDARADLVPVGLEAFRRFLHAPHDVEAFQNAVEPIRRKPPQRR